MNQPGFDSVFESKGRWQGRSGRFCAGYDAIIGILTGDKLREPVAGTTVARGVDTCAAGQAAGAPFSGPAIGPWSIDARMFRFKSLLMAASHSGRLDAAIVCMMCGGWRCCAMQGAADSGIRAGRGECCRYVCRCEGARQSRRKTAGPSSGRRNLFHDPPEHHRSLINCAAGGAPP